MNSILKKLGYKGQTPILILNSPTEYEEIIKEVDSIVHRHITVNYDFIQIFAKSMEEASELVSSAIAVLNQDGIVWLCYPKGTSKKYKSDITRDTSWQLFAPFEYEPVSMAAIDNDWSAIRFRHIDSIKKLTRKSASTQKGKERIGEK